MVLQALMFSNKYQINVIASQTKYGKIKSMKSWFQGNDMEIYSTRNDGKPFVSGRCIKKNDFSTFTCYKETNNVRL